MKKTTLVNLIREALQESQAPVKKQAKDLKSGDQITGIDGKSTIVSVSKGTSTPTGKVEVTLQYSNGKKETRHWNANTMLTVHGNAPLQEQQALMTGEELAQLIGNSPVKIEDGLKMFDYDNAEQFLRFFHKHNPEKVYRPRKSDTYQGNVESRFVAVDKPRVEKPSTYIAPKPLSKAQQDASVQRFYDDLKYKGD